MGEAGSREAGRGSCREGCPGAECSAKGRGSGTESVTIHLTSIFWYGSSPWDRPSAASESSEASVGTAAQYARSSKSLWSARTPISPCSMGIAPCQPSSPPASPPPSLPSA